MRKCGGLGAFGVELYKKDSPPPSLWHFETFQDSIDEARLNSSDLLFNNQHIT